MLTPLPIDSVLREITEAVSSCPNLILTATPGAGKTTRLPPELLKVVAGKVLILEPRRMAAVAACDRVAEERGWRVGQEVGYQVRFESKVSATTRLIFMTDALLLRKMVEDPELRGVDVVVLDEFHERNLNQDLILGCLRELQELGREIKVVVMSATLDVGQLLRFLPASRHIEVPGLVFPLTIRHSNQPLRLQTDSAFYNRVVESVFAAATETSGDILVFLPGQGEIARVTERLEERGLRRQIVPLHGSLPLAQQRAALAEPTEPRVILATNVAEASVTVKGVDYVIDCGLAKVMEINPQSGFSSLEIKRISQFNARQRAGRAARQKSGTCFRLWTPHEEATQPTQMAPEAQRSDLTSALLLLAHFGVNDFAQFAWLDAPPKAWIDISQALLIKLGLLANDRRLTELGRKLMRYPLPPRLGAFLVLAEAEGCGSLGAIVSAMLNEKDFVQGDGHASDECDVTYRLELLNEVERGGNVRGVKLRDARQVLESAAQLERLLTRPDQPGVEPQALRRLLLRSHRDRLCRRRGASGRGLMVGGRGVRLDENSQVRDSEFFLALQGVDLPEQTETEISLACGLTKAFVLETLRDEIVIQEDVEYLEDKGQFFARRVRTFADLPLEEPTLTPVDPKTIQTRMAQILARKWDWLVASNEALSAWMARWHFLVHHAPQFAAALQEAQILQTVELAAFGKTKVADVVSADLVALLEMSIERSAVAELHKQVPEKFTAPSGVAHRIQYSVAQGAYVDVRLQEIFGLNVSPRLMFDQVPVTFRLLGPNYRPVQVTSDLANFWRVGYLEVRKELRSRYPKHSWPDDPLTARPEARGRRNRS